MAEDNSNEPASAEKKQQPLAKSGDIAVWERALQNDSGFVYDVSDGPKGSTVYTTVFPQQGSHFLSAEEALALYLGHDVLCEQHARESGKPYAASLFAEGITEKEVQKDSEEGQSKVFLNRTLRVGFAVRRIGKDGEFFGHRIKGVDYFPTVKNGDREIALSAGDCGVLYGGRTLEKDGCEIFQTGIAEKEVEGRTYRNAQVATRRIQNVVAETAGQTA